MAPYAHTDDISDAGPVRIDTNPAAAALQQSHWPYLARMASFALVVQKFLEAQGFARAPWLAVGFAGGIASWFALPGQWEWLGFLCFMAGLALAAGGLMRADGRYPHLRQAVVSMALMAAAGCLVVWVKSTLVGTPSIAYPMAPVVRALVLDRYDQPAEGRVRLVLAFRDPQSGRAIKARVTLPAAQDNPAAVEGSVVRLKARLMPPAPPRLPGGYDFARAAWFDGLAASGTVLGKVELVTPAPPEGGFARWRHGLSEHVRGALGGSAGGIAAAFASGDRGGIAAADEAAMRDSGLTHLLSVSGLHVTAVVAGAYVLALRLLALWPWLALRVRLPVLASAFGGATGVFYTLLTGAQVPTVRSCLGALLVLGAVALGRQPLSMRLLAAAALVVMLLWPEAVVGPSFQMSFGAVMALIALHEAEPVRAFLARREEGWWMRVLRGGVMLLLSGLVIELALMPVTFFHFHRAGLYGSLANLVAIPLTTFVTMPLIALALVLDLAGAGQWAWYLCGKSLDLLLAIAHETANLPDAITRLPTMGAGVFVAFVGGMLWLALWHGRWRLLGLVPAIGAALSLGFMAAPDVLVTGDGRDLGLVDGSRLVVLRQGRSTYTRDAMLEAAGMAGVPLPVEAWKGAQCNEGFCRLRITRDGKSWVLLVARSQWLARADDMATACASVDIVIAPSQIPFLCRPRMMKLDEPVLYRTGGIALYLAEGRMVTVAQSQGQHPWWRAPSGWPQD